jgi:hypothetical protein
VILYELFDDESAGMQDFAAALARNPPITENSTTTSAQLIQTLLTRPVAYVDDYLYIKERLQHIPSTECAQNLNTPKSGL